MRIPAFPLILLVLTAGTAATPACAQSPGFRDDFNSQTEFNGRSRGLVFDREQVAGDRLGQNGWDTDLSWDRARNPLDPRRQGNSIGRRDVYIFYGR